MKNTEFKVGDRVRIRTDLVSSEWYGADIFAMGMGKYQGQAAKVIEIDNDEYFGFNFRIDLDGGYWRWIPEMVEKLSTRGRFKGSKNKPKEVIEIPKCPKTVTEKHLWHLWDSTLVGIPQCIACGLYDDRQWRKDNSVE